MESFFSSLKTERVRRKVYRSRDAARAGVFDYIERFHRHSMIVYLQSYGQGDRCWGAAGLPCRSSSYR